MARKAVFLDRDGTINVDYGYVYRREDFRFIPRAVEALRLLNDCGYMLVIVTNQSGIARGLYDERAFLQLDDWMKGVLNEYGVPIAATYYCPHHPQFTGPCACRKPGIALFQRAARELDIDFRNSWAIGNHRADLSICKYSSCRGILLQEEPDSEFHTAATLYEAARMIEQAGCIIGKEIEAN